MSWPVPRLQAVDDDNGYTKVAEVMDSWTKQIGYPVVTINTNNGEITQSHFLFNDSSESRYVLNGYWTVFSLVNGPKLCSFTGSYIYYWLPTGKCLHFFKVQKKHYFLLILSCSIRMYIFSSNVNNGINVIFCPKQYIYGETHIQKIYIDIKSFSWYETINHLRFRKWLYSMLIHHALSSVLNAALQ